jgi:uncharacterized repeat protein (TIGR01451 family)
MTNLMKRLASAGALVVVALGASPAFAAGSDTNAGTTISNSASVTYSVASVSGFTASTASPDVITVDRKVQFSVVEKATIGTTTVTPGQNGAVTIFDVTNTTNGALDIRIAAANLAAGSQSVHGGSSTDAYDVTNFTYYRENGLAAGFQATGPNADTLLVASGGVYWLDEVAEDAVVTVYVGADTATSTTNGQVAVVSLTGIAATPGAASTLGSVLADDSGSANTTAVQNVFNDAAGSETGDIAKDGKHSSRDSYTVSAPTLAVSKISWVISDPVNLTSNPKMIPGATVGYCITVANSGSQAADTVSVTDNLSALPVAYVASSAQVITGGPSGGTCSGTGGGGSYASGTVTGNLSTVSAGSSKSVWFTVIIN